MTLIKLLLLLGFVLMVWQLIAGLRALRRGDKNDPDKLMKALRWRAVIAAIIIASLFVLGATGLLQPHTL
ncbi:MAG: DUF2909 family protein [Moraxellaceae bacterium]|nr:DUF2909 family protein [Moraxellaceae bacterium]MDP1775997.1 DUF2909 family protein [Moraxellaceae bacterium]MDZ4298554.1 DUF2909 family protein [Moraxellaceae bacterium]MDZ4386837.1 DUF2909 family protein [Moraxellaceae bacterium]